MPGSSCFIRQLQYELFRAAERFVKTWEEENNTSITAMLQLRRVEYRKQHNDLIGSLSGRLTSFMEWWRSDEGPGSPAQKDEKGFIERLPAGAPGMSGAEMDEGVDVVEDEGSARCGEGPADNTSKEADTAVEKKSARQVQDPRRVRYYTLDYSGDRTSEEIDVEMAKVRLAQGGF